MNNNPEIAGAVQAEPDSADSELRDRLIAVRDEIGKVIVGQDAVITGLLTALLTRGHVLLEGVPGVAKTLMVKAFAAALDLEFGRVQFTPDLLPSDVTGQLISILRLVALSTARVRYSPTFCWATR